MDSFHEERTQCDTVLLAEYIGASTMAAAKVSELLGGAKQLTSLALI